VDGEKVCPECAETVKAEANVCRFCGYRFDGRDVPVIEVRDAGSVRRKRFLIWIGANVALMLIGGFGPWVKALGVGPEDVVPVERV
jgi:hypothetical protein